MKHRKPTRGKQRLVTMGVAAVLAVAGLTAATPLTEAGAIGGAGYTSVNEGVDGTLHCQNGNPQVNCNIYDGKQYVWMNGGPSVAYQGDGDYFFAVLSPGGQANPNDGSANNLSDDFDAYTNRSFSVSNGVVSYNGTHDFDSNKIRLADYADTTNPGGVYIMALCSLSGGYPVTASDCKYDAFKVRSNDEPPVVPAAEPTVTKDAAGAYDTTWTWGITKSVDQTTVTKVGPTTFTFHYTVSVTHDAGTDGNVTVSGTIDVENPNFDDAFATVPLTISDLSDTLSNGTECTIDMTTGTLLTEFDNYYPYSCSLASVPLSLDNTVTVTWDGQTLSNGTDLSAGSADFTFTSIPFDQTKVDDSVSVSDTYAGLLGTVTASDPSPTTFTYNRTVNIGTSGCTTYPNTAGFTTNTTATTGSASQTVTACGKPSGALTIGFWQNKNGQGIITAQAKTGVCPSATWLRQFAPFATLSATATCAATATYVYNVIKAASAGGTTMNPMLKAQMLATALDVYFSNPALGGNKINAYQPIGSLVVDLTKVCKMIDGSGGTATCSGSYENVSSAFGGATSMTVSAMLTYAASQSTSGGVVWYANVKATQGLAKDAFDAINNGVAFLI